MTSGFLRGDMVDSYVTPATLTLTMKLGRDGIFLIFVTMAVAMVSHAFWIWLSSILYILGYYIGILVILEVIKRVASGKVKNVAQEASDKLIQKKKLEVASLTRGLRKLSHREDEKFEKCGLDDRMTHIVFAKGIGAIPANFVGEIPDYLYFIIDKKIMYEVQRKYSTLETNGFRSDPALSREELYRVLEAHEVVAFHDFCKQNRFLTC